MDPQPEPKIGRIDSTGSRSVTFKRKIVRVLIADHAEKELDALSAVVQEEQRRHIPQSDHQILLRSIQEKLALLKINPEYGIHIARQKIPLEYARKHDITNLWKVNLAGAWRMLYTIRSNEIEILAIVFDILNHREYEKKFGYRKR